MMQVPSRKRETCPGACHAVTGGEPTVRDNIVDLVKKAKELGFPQVQIATNGVKLANNPVLAQQLKYTGLSTVYLHFDGVTPATNPFLKIHLKALENMNKAGSGWCSCRPSSREETIRMSKRS